MKSQLKNNKSEQTMRNEFEANIIDYPFEESYITKSQINTNSLKQFMNSDLSELDSDTVCDQRLQSMHIIIDYNIIKIREQAELA